MKKILICILTCLTIVGLSVGTLGACSGKKNDDSQSSSGGTAEQSEYNVFIYDEDMNYLDKLTFTKTTGNSFTASPDSRLGYEFKGLFDMASGAMIFNGNGQQSPMIVLDKDYNAVMKFEPLSYKIYFDAGEGKLQNVSDGVRNVVYNTDLGLLPEPKLNGKQFEGWYDSANTRFSFGTTPVNDKFTLDDFEYSGGKLNLHAVYSTKYYNVTLIFADGSPNVEISVEHGKMLPDLSQYYKDTGSSKIIGFGVSSTAKEGYKEAVYSDLELYAVWQEYKDVEFVYTKTERKTVRFVNENKSILLSDGEREGYYFDGWYISELLTGTRCSSTSFANLADIYYAKWSLIEYTVKFVADGALVAERKYSIENMNVTAPDVPAKPHFTGKWESYSLELKDITVNAVYEPVKIKITYNDLNGVNSKMVSYGESYSLPILEKRGYTFLGWGTDSEMYTDENGNSLAPSAFDNDITLKAKWSLNTYFVKFVADGVIISEQNISVENMTIVEPAVPAKEHCTGRWESYTIDLKNLVVNAIYEPVKAKIEYTTANGTATTTVSYGDSYTLPKLEKRGYKFLGFGTDDAMFTDENGKSLKPSEFESDIKLTAKWQLLVFTIRFVADGNEAYKHNFSVENMKIIVPAVPEKEGLFGRWEKYTLTLADITVNAVYFSPFDIKATLVSGSEISYVSISYYSDYTLKVPEKLGYDFVGWTYEGEFVTDENGNSLEPSLFENDVTLIAEFRIKTFTLTFECGGGSSVSSLTFEYGATYTITEKSERKGFFFAGWFDKTLINEYTEITFTDNVVVYAKWITSNAISDVNGLLAIASDPDSNYHLTGDINLKGAEWTPIEEFEGVFNGGGFKIYNFTMSQNGVNSAFIIRNKGTIRDLTFANVDVSNTVSGNTGCSFGIVTVYNEGKIINVNVEKSTIFASINCDVRGLNKNNSIGAIASENSGTVQNCSVIVEITTKIEERGIGDVTVSVGGVVGVNTGSISSITANIKFERNEYGYGDRDGTLILNRYFGGVVGQECGSTSDAVVVFNCNLSDDAGWNTRYSSFQPHLYNGGIAGYITNNGSVERCFVSGNVTFTKVGSGAGMALGGIAGYIQSGEVNNCASSLNITFVENNATIGGIVGETVDGTTVRNVAYYGTITVEKSTNGYVGGLVGVVAGNLSKSYVHGTITCATAGHAGAIAGKITSSGSVSKTISYANITDVYAVKDGSAKNNSVIGVDYDKSLLNNYDILFEDLCYYDDVYWAIDTDKGLYLISFPEKNLVK